MRSAYLAGCKTASEKYALAPDAWKHIAELAGLGILALNPAKHLLTDEKKDPWDAAEVGGLGTLGLPALSSLLKH